MVRTKRWLNVGALTVILVMVLGLSLPSIALAQWDRLGNLTTKANWLYQKGKYQEAVEASEEALRVAEKLKDHRNMAARLNNLALIYWKLGRYDRAEPLYKRALAINKKALGPDHPEVALNLNNLAVLYEKQDRYAEAEPLYKRSLAIREEVFGPDSPQVAQSLNNLALVYNAQGQYAKAEPLYQRALTINEKFPGSKNLEVAVNLNNLAVIYEKQARYAKAEPLYKRALAINKKALGPDHPEVALNLNNLAVLYEKQGRYAEAEPLHKRALAIREKTFGPDHPRVANVLKNMAKLYREMGRDDEAKKMLVRAKRSAIGISKSSEKIGKITPTELIQAVEEKEGIRFKVMMTSGVEEDNPIDFKTKFSVNDDDKMYVFVNWWDMVGDHRVTVIWSAPDQEIFAFNIYDVTLKGPDSKTWQSQKIFKNIPTGVWTFELYLDGKPLVAKRFTVTLDKVDETKKLLVRAKLSAMMEEKEGIQFKVIMTSGVEKNRPIDFKTQFSVNDDNKMYVFVYWPDRVGDHRVTVIWNTPDQEVFAENILDITFKTADWRTWLWQKMYKAMPKGDWTFALQLDGKHLVTKKFTVTD